MQSLFESKTERQRKEMEDILGKEIMTKLKRTSLRMKDGKFCVKLVLFEDDTMLDVSGSFAAFSFKWNDFLSEKERNIVGDTINSVFIYISETQRVEAIFTRCNCDKGCVTFEGVLAIVRQTEEEKEHSVESGIFASYVGNAMWQRQHASTTKLRVYLQITLGGMLSIIFAGARFYENDFNSRNPWNGVAWTSLAGMLGGIAVGKLLTMGDDNEHEHSPLDSES